jgi:hypothetical protein
MKKEQLIAKKVKHHFSKKEKQVLFDLISLEENYDGLLIHNSDIIYLEEGELVNGYVRAGDVNMDNAVPKETPFDLEAVNDQISKNDTIYQDGMKNPFEWKDGIVDGEVVSKPKEEIIVDSKEVLEVEVTSETIQDNPEFVEEGIVIGETIKVDAVGTIEEVPIVLEEIEVISEKVIVPMKTPKTKKNNPEKN